MRSTYVTTTTRRIIPRYTAPIDTTHIPQTIKPNFLTISILIFSDAFRFFNISHIIVIISAK